jgi:hypothetical protein
VIKDYILIIGAMKSGSTTLFAQLAASEKVAGCRPKEPGFFACEEVYQMGWDWYEDLFGFDPAKHRYALDASTDYTKRPFCTGVPERLAAAEAEGRRFKLIYIMRHPVDRLESHARHTARTEREVLRNQSPRPSHSLDDGLSAVNLGVSDYAFQLEVYRDWFERGDLHLLSLEEFSADAQKELTRIAAFLGLDELKYEQGPKRANAAADRREDGALVAAAAQAGLLGNPITRLVPKRLRRSLREATKRPVETPGRFRLTQQEREQLNERYGEQAALLRERYGFTPPWTFGA